MTRAGQQPALAVILVIAGVIGFGIGTWLGNATKPVTVAAAVATPSTAVSPSPVVTASPTPSPEPTQSPAPTSAPAAPQEVIFSIDGTSHDVTDSFEAKPGWQIQWQVDGESIAIAVSGDPTLGVVIDQEGPASGVTGIAQGGEFSLNIVANGPWKVTVIDGEEPAAS
ncbi:MAG TPA: hypothetical protein VFM38_00075 [Candidatus Limnocylindrales bacterium]|nr:hypothetical protein [Candidatus Limnocylindrales bacterium]